MGVVKHRLFWPIAALLTLVVINTLARPQFIKVTVRDGQLYGALIDILRNSAPLMLVALGMTIVIATRGIDLSVGAVMVEKNAVALLITEGFITTVNSGPFEYIATGYLLILPFAFLISLTAILVIGAFERRTALGMLTEAVGINPEASRLAGVRSRGIIFSVYVVSGLMAGIAGIIYSSNIRAADANAAGLFIELYAILAVVLGGTSLMGGKFTIAGTVIGVLTIQTLEATILFLGVPSAQSPVFFALVVVLVVIVQSPRVRQLGRRPRGATGSDGTAGKPAKAEV